MRREQGHYLLRRKERIQVRGFSFLTWLLLAISGLVWLAGAEGAHSEEGTEPAGRKERRPEEVRGDQPRLEKDRESDASSGLSKMSRKLVKLRSRVELLATRLRQERTQFLLELRGLEARRRQLGLLLDQERVRRRTLKGKLRKLRQKINSRQQGQKQLAAAVEEGLRQLLAVVSKSLPFRRKERLRAISQVQSRLRARRDDPETAATKVWRLLEDELRLTSLVEGSEIPLRLQRGAPPRLVQVVRLGMIALFTWIPPDQYGRMVRTSQGKWRHFPLKDPRSQREVRALFKALKKQVRQGFYWLPLQPPAQEKP